MEQHLHITTYDNIRLFTRFWEGDPDGDIIIYSHGLQSHSEWAKESGAFFQKYGFHFYAFDRRGSGHSDGRRGDISYFMQFVIDLVNVINFAKDRHPGRRVFLLALCWGAKPALLLSLYYPRLADALVLISPGVVTKKTIPLLDKILFPFYLIFHSKKHIRIPLESEMFTEEESYQKYIEEDPQKLLTATAKFFWESLKMQFVYLRKAHRISTPILTLLGEKDVIVHNKRTLKFHQQLGSYKKSIKIYPDQQHSLEFGKNRFSILKDIQTWIHNVSRDLPIDCTCVPTTHVESVDIFETHIPFKKRFSHALASREESNSLIVRITLSGEIIGYGEGLPRPYVTGETIESAVAQLKNIYIPRVLGKSFKNYTDVIAYCKSISDINPSDERTDTTRGAAWAALELALLDAYGIFFNRSISDVFGKPKISELYYSGVISAGNTIEVILTALKIRLFGFRQVKVKVGYENDANNLSIIRHILGPGVNIRVDANCAWNRNEAYNWIKSTSKINISALEQPLSKTDLEGFSYIARHSHLPIMVDESLTTLSEARKLLQLKCCHMFNIRISKCGGLLHALQIKKFADSKGIRCQIGCQVGETGILSAAGRIFATSFDNIDFVEGSYERLLLVEDIVHPRIKFGYFGRAYMISGRGLGLYVKEDILLKYVTQRHTIKTEDYEAHPAELAR
ncbi:alpha/beta fold hydrolase [PVC group bacterium]|nr:alpha/beta fold hydrolase [PVC group bacterium]